MSLEALPSFSTRFFFRSPRGLVAWEREARRLGRWAVAWNLGLGLAAWGLELWGLGVEASSVGCSFQRGRRIGALGLGAWCWSWGVGFKFVLGDWAWGVARGIHRNRDCGFLMSSMVSNNDGERALVHNDNIQNPEDNALDESKPGRAPATQSRPHSQPRSVTDQARQGHASILTKCFYLNKEGGLYLNKKTLQSKQGSASM